MELFSVEGTELENNKEYPGVLAESPTIFKKPYDFHSAESFLRTLKNPLEESQGIPKESSRILRILGISPPALLETSHKVFGVSSPSIGRKNAITRARILTNLDFIKELFLGRGKIEPRHDSSEIIKFWEFEPRWFL